ncbi:hypothetical protein [Bacteroides cellulosilyticus]|jgi:hypothetical protein|uniref:Transposase n=1 Tax=Bacteroides cellulosilyticus TaxID=246787 RepID=A0A5M6A199_9BACE|nr:hypothetical protein [Bacteroides cellulosilyticus]KAA5402051.1 hypothetical protein F2Y86_26780 [Bacteroides cellulosilyticus]RYU10885.1 hypothetical protein EAJ01_26830 [Bacteroides cellulosilyticus]
MYSNSDFERFFLRYKSEAFTTKESIQAFCLRNKVPYNLFEKWYKDTRHKLIPIQVTGHPDSVQPSQPESPDSHPASNPETVRIMVDIRMSNGVHIQQRNLSPDGLKHLVEKLEALC